MIFDRNSNTLTCTSIGGPPSTVNWRKDGVHIDNDLYQLSQRVVHTENATYENILSSENITDLVGVFTCEVINVRGSFEERVELNGNLVNRCIINTNTILYFLH